MNSPIVSNLNAAQARKPRDALRIKADLKVWICAAVYALLLSSSFSLQIFTIQGKYIFELAVFFCLAFYVIFRDSIGQSIYAAARRTTGHLALAAAVILIVALVGIINGRDFTDSYTDARSNFTLISSLLIGRVLIRDSKRQLIALAFMTAALASLHWALAFTSGNLTNKYPTPLFSAVMVTLLALDDRRLALAILGSLVLGFLAAASFFRQYWLIGALTIVAALVKPPRVKSGLSTRSKFFYAAVLASIGLLASGSVWSLLNATESLYIQSIGKTLDAVEFARTGSGSESDTLRIAYFTYLLDNFGSLIIPHGLGYKSNGAHFDIWFARYSSESSTLDSALLYSIFHYGYLFTIPAAFWLLHRFIVASNGRGLIFSTVLALIFSIPLLFDGGQLTVIQRAIWFGVFLAYIVSSPHRVAANARQNSPRRPRI